MSSEPAAAHEHVQVRERLHSLRFRWLARIFALLLVAESVRVLGLLVVPVSEAPGVTDGLLHAGTFLLVGVLLFRLRSIFVTNLGLEVRTGRAVRRVPWRDIVELREVAWMPLHPPWYPKRYEVCLTSGDALEFVGRRNAPEIANALRPKP